MHSPVNTDNIVLWSITEGESSGHPTPHFSGEGKWLGGLYGTVWCLFLLWKFEQKGMKRSRKRLPGSLPWNHTQHHLPGRIQPEFQKSSSVMTLRSPDKGKGATDQVVKYGPDRKASPQPAEMSGSLLCATQRRGVLCPPDTGEESGWWTAQAAPSRRVWEEHPCCTLVEKAGRGTNGKEGKDLSGQIIQSPRSAREEIGPRGRIWAAQVP